MVLKPYVFIGKLKAQALYGLASAASEGVPLSAFILPWSSWPSFRLFNTSHCLILPFSPQK